jgi:type I restriction-modification system DNA methylase subunit
MIRAVSYQYPVSTPPYIPDPEVYQEWMDVAPAHVLHALAFLKHGGRLVSVMPSSVTFRTDTLNRMVRAAVEAGGSIEALPENSFTESGTNVNTVIVTLQA